MQSAHASRDDAQWLFAALEALAVKRVPHLDDPLAVVVEALANALKHVPTMDVAAVQSDGIKQIMDVLVQLPRQDQYDVVRCFSHWFRSSTRPVCVSNGSLDLIRSCGWSLQTQRWTKTSTKSAIRLRVRSPTT
jgi:hypothetical protein